MTEEMEGQMSIFDLDSWSGRTYPEHSAPTKAKISESYSKKRQKWQKGVPAFLNLRKDSDGRNQEPSWEMGGALLGEYTMRSFGECPSEERESRLSQILEDNPLQKYCLSEKACQGILRRAKNRGKELPEQLKKALIAQAGGGIASEPYAPATTKESETKASEKENSSSNIYDVRISKSRDTSEQNSVYCLQGNGIDRADTAGCNGKGWRENESYTLNTMDRPAVDYSISSYESNAMKSSNPHSGIYEADKARTLDLNGGTPACNQGGTMILENHPADSRVKISKDGTFQTLSSRMGTGGGNVPMVMSLNSKQQGLDTGEELASTLGACDYKKPQAVCIGNGQLHDALSPSEEVAKTLNCMDDPMKVITYGLDRASFNQGQNAKYDFSIEEEKIGAQVARGPGAICALDFRNGKESNKSATLQANACHNLNSGNCCRIESCVRRLTPLECERLQGYPDGWTDIGDWIDSKGKAHKGDSDAPRYKALGNSIALPFWEWMAKRMVQYIDHEPTMASLFDGIGGFPLVYTRAGCKPIWASEIEEFPIAVTKKRFPEGEEKP